MCALKFSENTEKFEIQEYFGDTEVQLCYNEVHVAEAKYFNFGFTQNFDYSVEAAKQRNNP